MEKTIEELECWNKKLRYLLYFLVLVVGWTGAGIFTDTWFILPFVMNIACALVVYHRLAQVNKLLNACKAIHEINKTLDEKLDGTDV